MEPTVEARNGPGVVVVVPTYNERDNIETLIHRVLAAVPDGHILIVDDGSPDGTGVIVDELSRQDESHVSVLHRRTKEGLGAAYVAGFLHTLDRWPEVQYVVQMDADLSHDPRYIPALLEATKTCDVAIGSRYVHGVSIVNWPLRRLIISRMGTSFAKVVTGVPVSDLTSGFKCFRAGVLRALDLGKTRSNGYAFQIETVFRAWRVGYTLRDVPIIFYERENGQSKLNLSIAFETLTIVLRLGMERLFGGPRKKPAVSGARARQ